MPSKIFKQLLNKVPQETKNLVKHSYDIANRIGNILEEKQISQRDFAKMLGKEESEISKWLSGMHNFTLKTISKIEAVLGEEILLIYTKIEKEEYVGIIKEMSHTHLATMQRKNIIKGELGDSIIKIDFTPFAEEIDKPALMKRQMDDSNKLSISEEVNLILNNS